MRWSPDYPSLSFSLTYILPLPYRKTPCRDSISPQGLSCQGSYLQSQSRTGHIQRPLQDPKVPGSPRLHSLSSHEAVLSNK